MRKPPDTIGILVDLSSASARDILTGIFDYARRHAKWHIRLFQHPQELSDTIIANLLDDGLSGFINSLPVSAEHERRLAAIPVSQTVIMPRAFGYPERTIDTTIVANDDDDLGRRAAQYFLRLGEFETFAFVGPRSQSALWADEREAGFRDALREADKPLVSYHRTSDDPLLVRQELTEWLLQLPKPVAILAAYDSSAEILLEICEQAGIRVPQEASVIGVDNDELICTFSSPPLTSFQPDHMRLGYVAAAELSRLLRARTPLATRTVRIGGNRLIERESTRPPVFGKYLVERAKTFVTAHAREAITPADVVRFLGVSRRLADMRFREFAHATIGETILRIRLENVRRAVEATGREFSRIAHNNGFVSMPHLARLFKARYGQTMSVWRTEHGRKSHRG